MTTLAFIIGVIVGAVLGYAALLTAFKLMPTVKHQARIAREQYVEKESIGAFIEPPSDVKEALNEIFDRNAEQGRDTPLSEVL